MSEVRYTKEHEKVKIEGDVVAVGITDYAKDALGDLVFIELPDEGKKVSKDEEFAVVESVKIASEIYSPVDGEIVEVNEELSDDIEKLKEDIDDGWIAKIKISSEDNLKELMDENQYQEYLEEIE